MELMNIAAKFSKKQKYLFFIIIFIGFIIGFWVFKKTDLSILNNIKDIKNYVDNNNVNFIGIHLIILALLILSTIFFAGTIFLVIYFIWEMSCISFSIIAFSSLFKLSGFFYGLVYNLITKTFFLISIIIIFNNLSLLIKSTFFYSKSSTLELSKLKPQYFKILTIIIITIIYDFILYFYGNIILSKLSIWLS